MKRETLENFHHRLVQMRDLIQELEDARRGSSDVVELDQTRTGRLSRMDALQVQAMAKAGQARAQLERRRIKAALKRIEGGDYGYCIDCDEPIAVARLEANPTVILCVNCATARENPENSPAVARPELLHDVLEVVGQDCKHLFVNFGGNLPVPGFCNAPRDARQCVTVAA